MLSLVVFAPMVAAAVLAGLPRVSDQWARAAWALVSGAVLVLLVAMWIAAPSPDAGSGLAWEQQVAWMPSVGTSYHVGADGLSMPLLVLTAVLSVACAVYSWHEQRAARAHAALFLFLESTSLGLFASADLILFFVFFDLSLVAMYFIIARWGHGDAARSALKFFLYTFVGSLALLVGFIGLYVAAQPHTFDIVELRRSTPLSDQPLAGILVLAAIVVGLAVKTPVVPLHTWLPPAHTDAPAAGSAMLAGVLLKMGAYGFLRIAMPILPEAWRSAGVVIVAVGVFSVVYSAFVALAQADFKRMVAYTSVTHMGYVVMAAGVVGLVAPAGQEGPATGAVLPGGGLDLPAVALTGAVTQLVSHGLITGSLFLLAGVLHARTGSYDIDSYGGLGRPAPRFATMLAIAAFAALGLPGFSGFIAEFQIFAGSIGIVPATVLAVPGLLVTAALLVRALQRLLLGAPRGRSEGFRDAHGVEVAAVAPLLALVVLVGVVPRPLLDVVEPAATSIVTATTGQAP